MVYQYGYVVEVVVFGSDDKWFVYFVLVKRVVEQCFGGIVIGVLIGLVVLILEIGGDGVVVQ